MIEVRSPSRLHFGLLAFDPSGGRQFGGVGLMVRRPDVVVRVRAAAGITATGPLGDRAKAFARAFARGSGRSTKGAAIEVVRAPRPHCGLGTGTQLAMAVGRALAKLSGVEAADAGELAKLVDRGQRSAIGAYGFFKGGLIVEGGKSQPRRISPLLARQAFPRDWRVVLICPQNMQGVSGKAEHHAFGSLPAISEQATGRMCRLVLLGLLPALAERDGAAFGEALYELQQVTGRCFKSAQGGVYASPFLQRIVTFVRQQGVPGVGQSSWGPTLYAVTDDRDRARHLAAAVRSRFDLSADEVTITQADNRGAMVREVGDGGLRAPHV